MPALAGGEPDDQHVRDHRAETEEQAPVPEDPSRERIAYLPPRAARARKLILRSQLGSGWMLAAVLFGVVILVAGAILLLQGGRPGAPWVRVAPVGSFPDGAVTQAAASSGQVVVVDRREGLVRAFLASPGPCRVTGTPGGFARPCQREAWDLDGRPVAAPGPVQVETPALRPVPAQVAKGDLYVNARAAAARSSSSR